jgi:hypothetical protein
MSAPAGVREPATPFNCRWQGMPVTALLITSESLMEAWILTWAGFSLGISILRIRRGADESANVG